MVRCTQFYEEFDKKGNFCRKSKNIVRKVESYIEYMKRNRFGDFVISSNAIEPFIKIEHLNNGAVHKYALKKLREKIRKVGASKITRRISIEIINKANSMVPENDKITSIPDVRVAMGSFEHTIEGIEHETREKFDEFKRIIDIKDNNQVTKIMLDYCLTEKSVDMIKLKLSYEKMIDHDSKVKVVSEP